MVQVAFQVERDGFRHLLELIGDFDLVFAGWGADYNDPYFPLNQAAHEQWGEEYAIAFGLWPATCK